MRNRQHYLSHARLTFGIISILTANAAHASDGLSAYTEINSFSYSEPVSVNAQINKWDDHLHADARRAFTYNRVEAGVKHARGWHIGAIWRYDYRLSFSPDTAQVYHSSENDIALEKSRTYNLNLEVEHFRAHGVTLGHVFRWPKLIIAPSVSLLRADELMDGSLRGLMTVDADGEYSASAKVDYYYSEDALFDRPLTSSPEGWGYGVDLSLAWTPIANTEITLAIQDLFATIYWDRAPYTRASVLTEAKRSDENGFLSFEPVLSGTESFADYSQRLPNRHTLTIKRQLNDYFHINASRWDSHQTVIHTLGMGLGHITRRALEVQHGLEPGYWTLTYTDKRIQLSLSADALPFSSAHVLGANLRIHF